MRIMGKVPRLVLPAWMEGIVFFLSATGITAPRAKPTLRYEFLNMHKKRARWDKRVLQGKLIEWGRCPAYE